MNRRDQYLIMLAEIKREVAKAEKRLAHCRTKESLVLHRLQCIREEVAERRLTQADINIERAKSYRKHSCEGLVRIPSNIIKALFKPSASIADDVGLP